MTPQPLTRHVKFISAKNSYHKYLSPTLFSRYAPDLCSVLLDERVIFKIFTGTHQFSKIQESKQRGPGDIIFHSLRYRKLIFTAKALRVFAKQWQEQGWFCNRIPEVLRHPSKCPVQHLYPFLVLESDFVFTPVVLVYLLARVAMSRNYVDLKTFMRDKWQWEI